MQPVAQREAVTAIRAALLTFSGDPFLDGPDVARRYESDAIVAMADGRIIDCGPAADVMRRLPSGTPVTHYSNALISAGFIDAHVHYPQLPVIGAGGKPLLDWLTAYTFPAEARFADIGYARPIAARYVDENLRHGITTAAVFGTVHRQSVDALFEESERRGLRMIAGKVLMDRNAPAALLDTPKRGYDESKALIARWHGRGRLAYAVTPQFAATSTPEQLEAAAALWHETPDAYLHSRRQRSGSAMDRRALSGARALPRRLRGTRVARAPRAVCTASISTMPICNGCTIRRRRSRTVRRRTIFGSGLFSLHRARRAASRPVALATDLGGGTARCCARCRRPARSRDWHPLSPSCAWWLATRGAAEALDLGARVGSVDVGRDADLVVIDLASTPLIDFRMRYADSIDEALAVQFALGDDRAIRATYVAGRLAWDRDAGS